MNRRNIIIGVIVLVALAVGYIALGGGGIIGAKPTPTPAAALVEFENLVTASGTLVPVRRANLAFKMPGQVTKVAVAPGDVVQPGDPLIGLDSAELSAAVAIAQANLAQLKAGATREEIAVAQANLDAARAQLAKVRAGATPEEIAIAKASLDRAAANLKNAQAEYDKVRNDPYIGMLPQSAALEAAYEQYRIAEAQYSRAAKGATAEDLRVAESAVAVAQANLDRVKAGARPEEIAAAQARLDQANAALADATLTAPFAGTVAAVNVKEGEVVVAGAPVVMLGDLSALRLETDDLSETNIARVRVGQIVAVTFEALPGKSFNGKVTYIAPISSPKQGGTNYTIYVEFDQLDPTLRWGMTGHIEINTKQ
jgi:HlyD family secretion protein